MRGFLLYVIGYLYKMNFFETIYSLLIESVEDVNAIYDKYYASKLERNRFNAIAKADDATKVNKEGEIEKLGKYARLLMTLYINDGLKMEDLSLAQEYIHLIYKHNIKNIDWHKIKDLSDLHPFVEKYMAQNTETIDEILPYLDESVDYKVLHDGEQYKIYQPLTEKGACYLGVGATWCTTWGPLSLDPKNKDKTNRFKAYNNAGPLFIIVPKDNFDNRVQIHFEDDEFKNKNNSSIDIKALFENNELFNYFFPLNDKTTKEEMETMVERIKYLPSDKQKILREFKRKVFGGGTQNDELATIEDDGEFNGDTWIAENVDADYIEELDLDDDRAVFYLSPVTSMVHLQKLDDYLSSLRRSLDNDYPVNMHEPDHDDLYYLFMNLFENDSDVVHGWLGNAVEANDFEKFWEKYGDELWDYLRTDYYDKFNDLNYQNLDHAYRRMIENVTKYIDTDYDSKWNRKTKVDFNVDKFNDYVRAKDLTVIENFDQFIDDYCDYHDISTEDYDVWEYLEWDYPRYRDLSDQIDAFFTDEKRIKERAFVDNLHKQLKDFDNERHSWVWEDGEKKVEIRKTGYNIENDTIDMVYINKKTGEVHRGPVKVENIHKYATMNMLAEIYFKFKKNILL